MCNVGLPIEGLQCVALCLQPAVWQSGSHKAQCLAPRLGRDLLGLSELQGSGADRSETPGCTSCAAGIHICVQNTWTRRHAEETVQEDAPKIP